MNKKVMIIDDDKVLLNELEEMLGASGYNITAIDNTEAVLDTALLKQPDVILIDLKMPGRSGFELADEISRMSKLDNVPVIAMSAYFREDFKSLMNMCGIKKYLKKPFLVSDAISAIEDVMSGK